MEAKLGRHSFQKSPVRFLILYQRPSGPHVAPWQYAGTVLGICCYGTGNPHISLYFFLKYPVTFFCSKRIVPDTACMSAILYPFSSLISTFSGYPLNSVPAVFPYPKSCMGAFMLFMPVSSSDNRSRKFPLACSPGSSYI